MAISNLVSSSQQRSAADPAMTTSFRKSNANANLTKKSNMFGDTFITNSITSMNSLGSQLNALHDTSKKLVIAINSLIKDIKLTQKDILSKFKSFNTELNANRVDFTKNAFIAAPALDVPPIEDIGVPTLVAKNDTPVSTGGPSDITDTVKKIVLGMLGGETALRTLASLITFMAPVLTPAVIAGGFLAMIRMTIGEENRKLLDKLGITEDMPQDEIGRRKREYFTERKLAPQKEGAQRTILMREVMDGKHDASIGITSNMDSSSADRIRSKIAEDVSKDIIPEQLRTKMPTLPDKTPSGGITPGYGGDAGKVLQDSITPKESKAPAAKLTQAQRSQQNREKARQEMKGSPSKATPPSSVSAPAPEGKPPSGDGDIGEKVAQTLSGTAAGIITAPLGPFGAALGSMGGSMLGSSAYKSIKNYFSPPATKPDKPAQGAPAKAGGEGPQGDGAGPPAGGGDLGEQVVSTLAGTAGGLLAYPLGPFGSSLGAMAASTGASTAYKYVKDYFFPPAPQPSSPARRRTQTPRETSPAKGRGMTPQDEGDGLPNVNAPGVPDMFKTIPILPNVNAPGVPDMFKTTPTIPNVNAPGVPDMFKVGDGNYQKSTSTIQLAENRRIQMSGGSSLPPIVMNNSSSTNNGSVAGSEADNMSGQNFPMNANNPNLQKIIAQQNVHYQ